MRFSPESSALLRRADRPGEAPSLRFLCVSAALRETGRSVCRSVGSRKASLPVVSGRYPEETFSPRSFFVWFVYFVVWLLKNATTNSHEETRRLLTSCELVVSVLNAENRNHETHTKRLFQPLIKSITYGFVSKKPQSRKEDAKIGCTKNLWCELLKRCRNFKRASRPLAS